jgi:hypothetical protein
VGQYLVAFEDGVVGGDDVEAADDFEGIGHGRTPVSNSSCRLTTNSFKRKTGLV